MSHNVYSSTPPSIVQPFQNSPHCPRLNYNIVYKRIYSKLDLYILINEYNNCSINFIRYLFCRLLPDNLQSLLNKIFYVNIIGFPKDIQLMEKYQR